MGLWLSSVSNKGRGRTNNYIPEHGFKTAVFRVDEPSVVSTNRRVLSHPSDFAVYHPSKDIIEDVLGDTVEIRHRKGHTSYKNSNESNEEIWPQFVQGTCVLEGPRKHHYRSR
mmetsp:Transcript_112/g.246  ORF Transcript_112/g.246 Transcript_112/m.246 type:complete len:113 (+) Transcript_112:65-403(+)